MGNSFGFVLFTFRIYGHTGNNTISIPVMDSALKDFNLEM